MNNQIELLLNNETIPGTRYTLDDVKAMIASGLSEDYISKKLFMSLNEFREKFGVLFADIQHDSNLSVMKSLKDMAVSGKSLGATLYWIQTHCTHMFTVPDPPKTESANKWRDPNFRPPKDPNLAFDFDVYCNDGEPNADY